MTTMPTTLRSVFLTAMTVAVLFVLVISARASAAYPEPGRPTQGQGHEENR